MRHVVLSITEIHWKCGEAVLAGAAMFHRQGHVLGSVDDEQRKAFQLLGRSQVAAQRPLRLEEFGQRAPADGYGSSQQVRPGEGQRQAHDRSLAEAEEIHPFGIGPVVRGRPLDELDQGLPAGLGHVGADDRLGREAHLKPGVAARRQHVRGAQAEYVEARIQTGREGNEVALVAADAVQQQEQRRASLRCREDPRRLREMNE